MADETNTPASEALIQIRPLGGKDEDWYTIPTPSSYQYDRSDYYAEEVSFRDIAGEMNLELIATKIKLTLSWNAAAITKEEIAKLLKAIEPNFFEVKYFDPYKGDLKETTMYVGDRSLNMYSYVGGKPVWRDIAFNLIEK